MASNETETERNGYQCFERGVLELCFCLFLSLIFIFLGSFDITFFFLSLFFMSMIPLGGS
ncbi:hypothetical protein BJX99DRAFT_144172 [Aspergillus californicus]